MSKAKNILVTVGASMAVGAILGMLYAPVEGSEARRKLRRIKQKLTCCAEDEERETLEELSNALQNELDKVNERLEKM